MVGVGLEQRCLAHEEKDLVSPRLSNLPSVVQRSVVSFSNVTGQESGAEVAPSGEIQPLLVLLLAYMGVHFLLDPVVICNIPPFSIL